MADPETPEEPDFNDTLPEDLHIHKASVPGGWVFITYIQRTEGCKTYTTQVSTVYVPARR